MTPSRSKAGAALQRTYDQCYLTCNTAAYHESKGQEADALRCWREALAQVQQGLSAVKPSSGPFRLTKQKTDAEKALEQTLRDMELQCQERINLLQVIILSRLETKPTTLDTARTESTPESRNRSTTGPTRTQLADVPIQGLTRRGTDDSTASHSTGGPSRHRLQSPNNPNGSSSRHHMPPPPVISIPQVELPQFGRTPSPDKRTGMLTTLRTKQPVRRQMPTGSDQAAAAARAAGLAWDHIPTPSTHQLQPQMSNHQHHHQHHSQPHSMPYLHPQSQMVQNDGYSLRTLSGSVERLPLRDAQHLGVAGSSRPSHSATDLGAHLRMPDPGMYVPPGPPRMDDDSPPLPRLRPQTSVIQPVNFIPELVPAGSKIYNDAPEPPPHRHIHNEKQPLRGVEDVTRRMSTVSIQQELPQPPPISKVKKSSNEGPLNDATKSFNSRPTQLPNREGMSSTPHTHRETANASPARPPQHVNREMGTSSPARPPQHVNRDRGTPAPSRPPQNTNRMSIQRTYMPGTYITGPDGVKPEATVNGRKTPSAEGGSSSSTTETSETATTDATSTDPYDEETLWKQRVKQALDELDKGVDADAAKHIVNEIVVKGDEVHWDDVAGLEAAKMALKEAVVYPFLRPDLFRGLREPARGMLLFGPPGTGKTMIARAVATESRSTFFSISASSLTSKYLGESEKLVRALFALAKALAPSIIFVDEIDSLLSSRGSGEHEATRRLKTEFLIQWSSLQNAAAGKERSSGDASRVLVLGATNLPWAIDEAARRRFVRRQYIPLPESSTRKIQFTKLLGHQNHALDEDDLNTLVELTDGFSGSDITALAKDAAMGPLRSLGEALLHMSMDDIRPIALEDFERSLSSIRPSVSKEGLQEFERWAREFGERV